MTRPQQERYLWAHEVADMLAVSPKTVTKWAKENRLPYMRTLGGHRRYPASVIEALRDQLTTRPDQEVRG